MNAQRKEKSVWIDNFGWRAGICICPWNMGICLYNLPTKDLLLIVFRRQKEGVKSDFKISY